MGQLAIRVLERIPTAPRTAGVKKASGFHPIRRACITILAWGRGRPEAVFVLFVKTPER